MLVQSDVDTRILFVIPYFFPAEAFGGPVKVAFDVSKELVKRGHEVVVFTSDAKDLKNRLNIKTAEFDGVKVCYFSNLSMFLVRRSNLFITPKMRREIELTLNSFDIIHAHEYTTYQNIIVHKIAMKYKLPYVVQVHGSLPKVSKRTRKWFYDTLYGRKLLQDASRVIALSSLEFKQYESMGVDGRKIVIIPNGLNVSEYTNLPNRGLFKSKLRIDGVKKLVLYLGRVHKTKGIDLLVEAYSMLHKTTCQDSMLVIAGPDAGYLAEAKRLAASLNISDSVIFTGFISNSEKLEALVDADVFVTPSFYGFPLTFLESCIVGTPIITTTTGDTLDWIDGTVGYTTSPTPHDLSRRICSIISNDELREKLSRNCKETVKSNFSLESIVDKLEQMYEECIE